MELSTSGTAIWVNGYPLLLWVEFATFGTSMKMHFYEFVVWRGCGAERFLVLEMFIQNELRTSLVTFEEL